MGTIGSTLSFLVHSFVCREINKIVQFKFIIYYLFLDLTLSKEVVSSTWSINLMELLLTS